MSSQRLWGMGRGGSLPSRPSKLELPISGGLKEGLGWEMDFCALFTLFYGYLAQRCLQDTHTHTHN